MAKFRKKNLLWVGLMCLLWNLGFPAQACEESEDCFPDMLLGPQDPLNFDVNLLFSTGYVRPGLGELNRVLTSQDYLPVSEHQLQFGSQFQLILWHILAEFEGNVSLTPPTFNDDFLMQLTTGNVLLNGGYVFSPLPGLQITPLAGLGMSFLDMRFTRRNLLLSFDEYLANPGRQGDLGNVFFTLHGALQVDWRWDWGFQIGLRGGYYWTPASNWWGYSDVYRASDDSNNTTALAGGPAIALSGPYLKLLIGF